MYKDDFKNNVTDSIFTKGFTGEIHDTVKFLEDMEFTTPTGEVVMGKTGESLTLEVANNLVLDSFSKIIALLIKGDDTFYKNLWWEMGRGASSWSNEAPPSPLAGDVGLLTPFYRKRIDLADVKFIDAKGDPSEDITNRLEISLKLLSSEANGDLREFGIFSGGTVALGSGIPINRKTHGLIYKTSGIEITRKIHFKF